MQRVTAVVAHRAKICKEPFKERLACARLRHHGEQADDADMVCSILWVSDLVELRAQFLVPQGGVGQARSALDVRLPHAAEASGTRLIGAAGTA